MPYSILMKWVYLLSFFLGTSHLSSQEKPNILFIISDDLTACLGSYGNTVCKTPNLDRLAKEGVRFTRAYCQYPVCGPSRASLMSGLYPHKTKMLGNNKKLGSFHVTNPELADHPSLGGFLRRNGYVSFRVSKIYHMGVPGGIEAGEPGGDDPDSWDRAFDIMAPETASPGKLELLSPKRKHYGSNFARVIVPDGMDLTQADHLSATQAIAILENRAKGGRYSKFIRPDQPFFLAVGFVRPHVPLIAPKRIFSLYPEGKTQIPKVPEGDLDDLPQAAKGMHNPQRYGMSLLQKKQSIAAYYASVTYMDEQVGRLLDTLDRLHMRENTIVVFTSDHGFNLGEHDMWQKLSLFEDSLRVPLIISAPGFEDSQGKKSEALVELIDLYPTLVDLAGLKAKAPKILQGESLRPQLTNPGLATMRKVAYSVTYRKGQSVRADRYRYNLWGNGGEELYDHELDPKEFKNLVRSKEHQDELNHYRKILQQKREESSK